MTANDLDTLAREAAAGARAAVAPVVASALTGDLLADGPTPATRRRAPRLVAAGVLAAALTSALLAADLTGPGKVTELDAIAGDPEAISTTTTPAVAPPPEAAPPPDAVLNPGRFVYPWELPGAIVVATGTTSAGLPWGLSYGGPSNELCLAVVLGDRTITSACGGLPYGQPFTPEQRRRPLVLDDARVAPHVFGHLPDGAVAAEVTLAGGGSTARQPVIASVRGPVYAFELPPEATPVEVVGYLGDGSAVRYPVTR